jgi:tRNA (guanine37-N1)-methyltransferase
LFDFKEVYWNSKLSVERDRVLKHVKANEVVCDVFAGVGPFAIRCAKKGCRVIANDLNPNSYKYLIHNSIKNKVKNKVSAYCTDARDFLTQFLTAKRSGLGLDNFLESPSVESLPATFDHLYMNLPMDAVEFLDVLKGKFDRDVWKKMPVVHVYGFAHSCIAQKLFIERIKQVWGDFNSDCIALTQIRDISPKKFMFCIEFTLPQEIAFSDSHHIKDYDEETVHKKIKIQE